jgi:hypothetical protein
MANLNPSSSGILEFRAAQLEETITWRLEVLSLLRPEQKGWFYVDHLRRKQK